MNDKKLLFAKTLKDIRLKKGFSQEDISEISYININTISRMENGRDSYDFDKLDILSDIYKVDLIECYFDIFYGDSNEIDNIIDSINKKDRINGSAVTEEIDKLTEILEKSKRKVIKTKANKLILFLKSIEEKDNYIRKKLILEALNIGGKFDFDNLNNNYYDYIDYRVLMNYAQILERPEDRINIYKFIEESNSTDNNINYLVFHNMAIDYYILGVKDKALEYINKSFSSNPKSYTSPVMLYTKALILEDLDLSYEKYIKKSLEIAKNQGEYVYNTILEHWENRFNKNKQRKIHISK